MLSVRYVQQVEINQVIAPSTTNDFVVLGSPDYAVIIDELHVTGYNSANIFTGGQLRLLVYIGYTLGFFDRIPTQIGGSVLFFADNVARGFYTLNQALYLPENRYLRVYVSNQSTSLTQHVQALVSYRIV